MDTKNETGDIQAVERLGEARDKIVLNISNTLMKMKIHSTKMRWPLGLIAMASLALLLAPSAGARTWTSADGSKTFEAELQSYDAASGQISVTFPNGKRMTFLQGKLSEDDIAWLRVTQLDAASKGKSIAADHKELMYTGRIDFSDKKAPKLSWPGSMVRATFTGSSIQVKLNCSTGNNYFDVYIDGKYDSPVKIDCEKGSKTYSGATDLKGRSHTVTLYKRTEGEEGSAQFQGFVLSVGGKLLAAPARPERRIEFFGDSITSGFGCERGPGVRDGQVVDKNSFKSYAGVAAKELKAECHFTSCSGIGVVGGWTPFTMPLLYDKLSANEINGTKWDFKKWVPHVVVVNLFENDRSRAKASDEQFVEGYVKFVNSLRAAYPKAHVICTLGSMSAARKGSKWIGFVEKAVDQIREQDKTAKIDSVIFFNNGQGGHPRADRHKEMAKKLTDLINDKVTWGTKFSKR